MPARRTLIQVLVAVGVLGWVGWEALREPVQLAHVEKAAHAPMTESFSEEGKTRLKARYALAAPVAGQLRRVTLQPGDAVQAGQVVAWIDPTSPVLLDGRSRRRAEAELAAARSQHRYKPGNAQLAGLFSNPIEPVLFDQCLTEPEIGHIFTGAQLALNGEYQVAFAHA